MSNTKAMQDYINTYENPIIQIVIQAITTSKENFSAGDQLWIMRNQSTVFEFFKIADNYRITNTKPMPGSWAVANDVRNKTRARQNDSDFKLNNNYISLLAHSYNACPGRQDHFIVRDRKPLDLPAGYIEGQS